MPDSFMAHSSAFISFFTFDDGKRFNAFGIGRCRLGGG